MLVAVFLAACVSIVAARYHGIEPISLTQTTNATIGSINPAEHTIDYWRTISLGTIKARLGMQQRQGPAKNVILFLGDGMSMATITASRVYMGQLHNRTGDEQQLSFEKFPYTGLSKTYCVDSQVADSACSVTAYLSGVKGNYHTIGVTADVKYLDWRAMQNESMYTTSIATWAQKAGKGTGIVTTCKVTDASPTGAFAHTASRYWQTDLNILADAPEATGVKDITSQLVENTPGTKFKVILGGGRQVFLPKEQQDEYGYNGTRGDGKDLINKWKSAKAMAKVNASYVTNRDQLLGVDFNNTEYLLGLFHPSHMDYHLIANSTLQPTLSDMTWAAINMMQKEKNGYFLFIEGGRIDHGHHDDMAHFALDETVEFHKAIEVAELMTSEEDTLIVVTADHAHTMTMNGYPTRGSDIFTTLQSARDNLTYPTLTYANGPNKHGLDISTDDRGQVNYTFPRIYSLSSETHDGQDVAVYAKGPCAHLLVGNYEQTVIPHVMAYAARIGPAAQVNTTTSSGQPALLPLSLWALGPLLMTILSIKPYF